MQHFVVMSASRRVICGVLLVAQAGCLTTPRAVGGQAGPGAYLQANSPKRIWVTLTNGQQLVIDAPRVYGDTLLGVTKKGTTHEEVWLPLTDLQDVRTRQVSGGRTALFGGVIAAVLGLVLIAWPTGSGSHDRPCMNEGDPCDGT
jgi:hypothetical protein